MQSRLHELKDLERFVRNELSTLEKGRQRSTYEFRKKSGILRPGDRRDSRPGSGLQTKIITFDKRKLERPQSAIQSRCNSRLSFYSTTSMPQQITQSPLIPIGTDVDEAPPAALRKSFTIIKDEKQEKEKDALIAFVDTFRGYQRKINLPKKEFWQKHLDESIHFKSPSYRKIETVIKWVDPEELAMAEEKRRLDEKSARKRAGSLQPHRKDKRSDRPTRRVSKTPMYTSATSSVVKGHRNSVIAF